MERQVSASGTGPGGAGMPAAAAGTAAGGGGGGGGGTSAATVATAGQPRDGGGMAAGVVSTAPAPSELSLLSSAVNQVSQCSAGGGACVCGGGSCTDGPCHRSHRGKSLEPFRWGVPPSSPLLLYPPSFLPNLRPLAPPPIQTFESTGGLPTEAVLSLMTALGEVSAKCLPTQVSRGGRREEGGEGGRGIPAHNAGLGVA